MMCIQKSLSILLFMESRRTFLIQQYLNHLLKPMVDHFIKKKTQQKPSSCCCFVRNQQDWWETV